MDWALIAGHRGWSMMGRLLICSVAVSPSALNVRPFDGTGVTQYRPSNEIGEWKSWNYGFMGTASTGIR